jgi:hypothetical protein
MSANESFLARWARRKHAAATNAPDKPKPEDAGGEASSAETALAAPQEGEGRALVDPESLPPIEMLGAGSDVRPFLADGVPADLTRAALRHAWSADPAIRDFIGLSENSWDFNGPGGIPGFGALTVEDARRLLTQVTKEAEALGPPDPAAERLADDQASAPAGQFRGTISSDQKELGADAAQHEGQERESRRSPLRRRHGDALPD